MALTPEELKKLVKHEKYYIPSADLSFLLGHIQFRVHRYFFERESEFYRGRLTTPVSPGATRHGSSDSDPLVLEDVKPEDFARFCWVFYNTRYSLYDATVDDWSVILSLAHKWGFGQVKALAVRELEKKEFSDIDRVAVYQSNTVDRNLLIPRFAALCARESPLTLEEGLKLGMETTLVIASAREYVRSARTSDGGRTPITPTVQGDELYNIIRELFGIPPAPVPKADEKAKDEPKASASSGGLLQKLKLTAQPQPPPLPLPLPLPQPQGSQQRRAQNQTPQSPATPTSTAQPQSTAGKQGRKGQQQTKQQVPPMPIPTPTPTPLPTQTPTPSPTVTKQVPPMAAEKERSNREEEAGGAKGAAEVELMQVKQEEVGAKETKEGVEEEEKKVKTEIAGDSQVGNAPTTTTTTSTTLNDKSAPAGSEDPTTKPLPAPPVDGTTQNRNPPPDTAKRGVSTPLERKPASRPEVPPLLNLDGDSSDESKPASDGGWGSWGSGLWK